MRRDTTWSWKRSYCQFLNRYLQNKFWKLLKKYISNILFYVKFKLLLWIEKIVNLIIIVLFLCLQSVFDPHTLLMIEKCYHIYFQPNILFYCNASINKPIQKRFYLIKLVNTKMFFPHISLTNKRILLAEEDLIDHYVGL